MSGQSLTRARKYDQVVFKDSSGKEVKGVALVFRSDYMLVGVTNPTRPTVTVQTRRKDGTPTTTRVPNNAIWGVAYDDIIRTEQSKATG